MSVKNNGYKFSYKESEYMTIKAIRIAGNALDLVHPSEVLKWSVCAETMIKHWKREQVNFQLLLEMEKDVIMYAYEELVTFTSFIMGDKYE